MNDKLWAMGLSPRTRGNQPLAAVADLAVGPIPADAGEPARSSISTSGDRAYPRGRGGTRHHRTRSKRGPGLSPRTRGNHRRAPGDLALSGPIPADAGEPLAYDSAADIIGAYPRGRGGTPRQRRRWRQSMGLSPRTRGNHQVGRSQNGASGPIPADAGEPTTVQGSTTWPRAYPRGRGGTRRQTRRTYLRRGLSPRTRGNREYAFARRKKGGPIPADAGEPEGRYTNTLGRRAYPRGRGGTVHAQPSTACNLGLSPRTRGNPDENPINLAGTGPIPADAGEPMALFPALATLGAYPRGRGGTSWLYLEGKGRKGLSPRTRGNPPSPTPRRWRSGPIPADAGEPSRRPPQ